MISFESDYINGVHPEILKRIIETNNDVEPGYGFDSHTKTAIAMIKEVCCAPDAEVFLATGGTQTNQLVISAVLKSYEGVVAAETGHVGVHEAGAIEYSGHKVLTLPQHEGKIDAGELKSYLETFYADGNHEHMVYPGMVYISHPTEYGSLYSKSELEAISRVCREYKIPLYLDGARLIYGITSSFTNLTLADIAKITDIFYIGGTKAGTLCGEAIVFTKKSMPEHFLTIAKQHGALLAKGRLPGVQFEALFTSGLYLKIGIHANEMKDKLLKILKSFNMSFFYESPTNQQFVIVENSFLRELEKEICVSFWEKYDENHTVVRFATSWSTTEDDLDQLEKILELKCRNFEMSKHRNIDSKYRDVEISKHR